MTASPSATAELRFDIPIHFHDLGMHLDDRDRAAHLEEIAAELWPGGTQDQRAAVHGLYGELADAAAADGAVFAGFCMFSTDDDRISTASLVVRADPIEPADPDIIMAGLLDFLSLDPVNDVHRQELDCGPAAVVFSALDWRTPGQSPLTLAKVDVYAPLPDLRQLVVLSLTTPSLPELPDYVALLSQIADTIRQETD